MSHFLQSEISQNEENDSNLQSEEFTHEENIEMQRIMKMNFYQFKSKEHNGIVGMCQDIKNRGKSPSTSNLKSLNTSSQPYLNKSLNSCANLMLSNALLSKQKTSNKSYMRNVPLNNLKKSKVAISYKKTREEL